MKLRNLKLRRSKDGTESDRIQRKKIENHLNPIYDTMFEEIYGKEMVSNFWKLGDYEF